jgi:transcriptional regulator with PAS, ATPase and Fis domain
MRAVVSLTEKLAANDSTVLILGESGVGKGVIADLIHTVSRRSDNHKVSINCGAIPELLLESELFGYVKGAFTGANREGKIGLIEAAEGGTVILDEIGELPLSLQPKLLTFLETGEISKVGSTETKKVDSRIIAVTNKHLETMVHEGKFREDLYYRLNVIPIVIPPLRERREDIVPLILLFLNKYNRKNGCDKTIAPELLEKMQTYDWPGNIRQLRNTIERLAILSADSKITISDLGNMELTNDTKAIAKEIDWPIDLGKITQDMEEEYIHKAMKKGGSIRETAKLLGITPSMLYRKMNR